MRFPRSSGILLHPTSLASRYGIGDLGAEARRFVDFLASAGQKLWQVLPLGPTEFGQDQIDFERLVPWKTAVLQSAVQPGKGFEAFCEANQHWLDDFSLFVAL